MCRGVQRETEEEWTGPCILYICGGVGSLPGDGPKLQLQVLEAMKKELLGLLGMLGMLP